MAGGDRLGRGGMVLVGGEMKARQMRKNKIMVLGLALLGVWFWVRVRWPFYIGSNCKWFNRIRYNVRKLFLVRWPN